MNHTLGAVNVALGMVAIVLLLNLVMPVGTLTGELVYNLDLSDPECYFSDSGELHEIPLERCCYAIQKQFTCEAVGQEGFDLRCYISKTSERYYLVNDKAFSYCKKEGYDVHVE